MKETSDSGLVKIRRALISVSDKTGIIDFAQELKSFGVEIISTGGTAKSLRDAGIEVRDVSDVTGFPEMMDGRIKTLHPKIHGGLLALRDNPEHLSAMDKHAIAPIDMVVINLYPFEQTIAREGVTMEEAIEQIDIGGPAMIRSAAKNWENVAVIVSPGSYGFIAEQIAAHAGALPLSVRSWLVRQAFQYTSRYDELIDLYLSSSLSDANSFELTSESWSRFPWTNSMTSENNRTEMPVYQKLRLKRIAHLRYGENPHQKAALYDAGWQAGVANAELLSGKEMSFNNYVDADAAWQLVSDFDETACAIIKHTNPAGVALGASTEEAYRRALACDPVSAFGGIVAFNRTVDPAAAREVIEIFTEVVIAPDFDEAALEILKTKTNAIVYSRDKQTVGVGAGQMSRVDSVNLGAMRSKLLTEGSVMASDAFFPFRDGIDEAAKHGITAVIQPGGSVRDEEVVAAADEHSLAMVFTGIRHFKH